MLVSEFWFKIGVRFDTGFKHSCRISGYCCDKASEGLAWVVLGYWV